MAMRPERKLSGFFVVVSTLLFLLLANSAYATTCYQESANGTTNCTGEGYSTGRYNATVAWNTSNPAPNVWDEDWGTYGRARYNAVEAIIWVNYTKPDNATNQSQVQYNLGTKGTLTQAFNTGSFGLCFTQNPLRLRVASFVDTVTPRINSSLHCYTGSSWLQIDKNTSTSSTTAGRFYEEGMLWDINHAAAMNTSRIAPNPAYANASLLGYCNATDVDGDTVKYNYRWFKDDALYSSGTAPASAVAQGLEVNVANVSGGDIAGGHNWTLECTANDTLNLSDPMNTSIVINGPIVHLVSPSDGANVNDPNQTFACNITSTGAVKNLTLYVWNSSSTNINTSNKTLTGSSNSTSWTINLSSDDGTYTWNCLGYEASGNYSWGYEDNLTLTLHSYPTFTSLVANSSDGKNRSITNLTAYVTGQSERHGKGVILGYDWRVNGTSIDYCSFNFDVGNSVDTTAAQDFSSYGNNATAVCSPGCYLSTGGHYSTGAFLLDGVDDYITTSQSFSNPQNFTITLWFKTSTKQGKLIGFGTSQYGASGGYDRQIYMTAGGALIFGVNGASGMQTILKNTNYADGNWHFVAASLSTTDGAKLYVDNALGAKQENMTDGQAMSGYWRIGYDNLASWPSEPSSYFFNGTLDDVGIYNRVLSTQQLTAIYQNRTDILTANELRDGDNWTTCVTTGDTDEYGLTNCTSGLLIHDPSLSVSVVSPSGYTEVPQKSWFNVTLNVTCSGNDCDSVSVSLDPSPTPRVEFFKNYTIGSSYGGFHYAIPTGDGYIVAGESNTTTRGVDGWVIKTDLYGTQLWNKTAASSSYNQGLWQGMANPDGNYTFAGYYDVDGTAEGRRPWLYKINGSGSQIFSITYGTTYGASYQAFPLYFNNGNNYGMALVGGTDLISSTVNAFIQIYNLTGTGILAKEYGTTNYYKRFNFGKQTSDGGFILAGETNYSGAGKLDIWVVKLNTTLGVVWEKRFGTAYDDHGYGIDTTSDGDYIISGTKGTVSAANAYAWLIKLNSSGDEMWNKTFGGTGNWLGVGVFETAQGNLMFSGSEGNYGAGANDSFVIKTDANGSILWNMTIGGTGNDATYLPVQTPDGGYIVSGDTTSFGSWPGVFLKIASDEKVGLVSNTTGARPFWTNGSNPVTLNLSNGQSQLVTFWVNATGMPDVNFTFFAFANWSAKPAVSVLSSKWNMTIRQYPPNVSSVVLNSTTGMDTTLDNLTAYPQGVTDTNPEPTWLSYDWKRNGTSIETLDLKFDVEDTNHGIANGSLAKTSDYSSYGNDATLNKTIYRTPTWNESGGWNNSGTYYFDGDASMDVTDQDYFSPSNNNMAIMFWAYVPSDASALGSGACGSTGRYFISKMQYLSNYEWGFENDNNNLLCFDMIQSSGTFHASVNKPMTVNDGQWHHYAASINYLNNLSLYVDGQLQASNTTFTGTMTPTAEAVHIGTRPGSNYNYVGYLDEIKIFNRALSSEEIALIAANRSNVLATQELAASDNWSVCVTPNDGYQDGNTTCSNGLYIYLPPSFSSPSNTSSGFQHYQNFTASITIIAESGVSAYIFSTNASGAWSNRTMAGGGDTTVMASQQANLTAARGSNVCWYYWANDTGGRSAASTTYCFTVNNGLPIVTGVILNSTNNTNMTTENLTAYPQGVSDAEGDNVSLMYDWQRNGMSIAVLNMNFDVNNSAGTGMTRDYSTLQNNGTATAIWNATGGWNGTGAYMFNGTNNSYINLTNNSAYSFERTSAFSVAAWINARKVVSPIVSKLNGSNIGWEFYVGNAGNLTLTLINGSTANAVVKRTYALLNDSAWHHVAVAYTGSGTAAGVTLYIDGAAASSYTENDTLTSSIANKNPTFIGARASLTNLFNGSIDNVQIYNRTLSAQEIAALYNNRTDLMVSQELQNNEDWTVCVTPNDGLGDGSTTCSNTVYVTIAPVIVSVILNSTRGLNSTTENLTAYPQGAFSPLGNNFSLLYDWQRNGTSIAVLNMNFDVNNSAGTNKTRDYSTFGNNGTVNGAVWNATAGWNGTGGYVFNGSARNITANISGTVQNAYTVMAFVKVTDNGTRGIIGTRSPSDFGFDLKLMTGNKTYADIGNGTAWIVTGVGANFSYALNQWYHIAYVVTTTGFSVYVNGLVNASGSYGANTPLFSNATHLVSIGTSATTEYFNGTIDNVMVYNRSLSAAEILALYNNRTDLLVSNELTLRDNWTACVTPNDALYDGRTVCSNSVYVTNVPTILSVILNSTKGTNTTTENLTAWPQNVSSPVGNNVSLVYDWRNNGTSIATLNMNFDINNSAGTGMTRDYSTYGSNGNASNATWNATGGLNGTGAYEFNGINNIINVTNESNYDFTSNFTLSVWIKVRGYKTVSPYLGGIIGKDALSPAFTAYALRLGDGTLANNARLHFVTGNGSAWNETNTTTTVPLNLWQHIVVTVNDTNMTIYMNATAVRTTPSKPIIATNDIALYIGDNYQFTDNRYFNGTIDNVMIFNRSLSAAEVLALYNNQSNLLVTQELVAGNNWTTCVTPNDAIEEGGTVCSNNVLERLISCSYSGGNWLVQCVDNCAFSTNIDMLGNNITFSGSGTVNITANITNFTQAVVQSGCNVALYNNSNLKGGR